MEQLITFREIGRRCSYVSIYWRLHVGLQYGILAQVYMLLHDRTDRLSYPNSNPLGMKLFVPGISISLKCECYIIMQMKCNTQRILNAKDLIVVHNIVLKWYCHGIQNDDEERTSIWYFLTLVFELFQPSLCLIKEA